MGIKYEMNNVIIMSWHYGKIYNSSLPQSLLLCQKILKHYFPIIIYVFTFMMVITVTQLFSSLSKLIFSITFHEVYKYAAFISMKNNPEEESLFLFFCLIQTQVTLVNTKSSKTTQIFLNHILRWKLITYYFIIKDFPFSYDLH